MADHARHDEYLGHLPIGRDIEFDGEGMPGWEIFPFEVRCPSNG